MAIIKNLNQILEKIESARVRAGRDDKITLIGVSKTHPASLVREAFEAGLKDFGENRIQEAVPKIEEAAIPAIWHLVGHLQSNKAKIAALNFSWIHSIDSLKTSRIISRTAQEAGRNLKILIEVNTSGEASKHGVSPEQAPEFFDQLLPLNGKSFEIAGLMTIGPLGGDEKANRKAFALLRSLRDTFRARLESCAELSMGMSGDFESAILEGASMLRIGSAIFGERD